MAAGSDFVILYTAQRQAVVDILQNGNVYYVEKKYIREKYGEVSGVFLTAYEWYAARMAEIVPKPPRAESAVWAFIDGKNAGLFNGGRVLVLEVPINEIVFFDMLEWERVLNGEPLGNQIQRNMYEEKLRKQGVANGYDVLSTAFYPLLKRELLESWKSLFRFDKPFKQGQTAGIDHIQAGLWQLDPQWVKKII